MKWAANSRMLYCSLCRRAALDIDLDMFLKTYPLGAQILNTPTEAIKPGRRIWCCYWICRVRSKFETAA